MIDTEILATAKHAVYPLAGQADELTPLLDTIGDASYVLLGESTHGTQEFYEWRARISMELIQKKGFNVICLEADWPDAYHVHRYLGGLTGESDSMHALAGFKRFPQWMWRNTAMVSFISSLYHHNRTSADNRTVSLYGLDLYSLYQSITEVLIYLDKTDAAAAQRARSRYNCLQLYQGNAQRYGYATFFDISASCQFQVIEQLRDLQKNAQELRNIDGPQAREDYFSAEQNAQLIKNAEEYYRSLFFGTSVESWNIRDRHMMNTIESIIAHKKKKGENAKIIVWAHNSHVGNAAATQLGKMGEITIGQLMKETYKDAVRSIGFTTYTGTISAASEWDRPVERKKVVPALPHSYESLFHQVGIPAFMLFFNKQAIQKAFRTLKLERAIGVIYRPETERESHYFTASLSDQFDAIIHIDQTTALEPLEKTAQWSAEFPETYPTGM